MPQPLFISVQEFCKIFSIGRTKFYELREAGEFEAVKIGSRTLVLVSSALEYAERLLSRDGPADSGVSNASESDQSMRRALCNTHRGGSGTSGERIQNTIIEHRLLELRMPESEDSSNMGGRDND